MQTPEYLAPLEALPGIKAGFIPRIPGVEVSTDKIATLVNLQPHHDKIVLERGFQPGDLWLAEQVHGAEVAVIDDQQDSSPHLIENVDGLISSGGKKVLLGIHVADCGAIWLCDKVTGALALLHSGKKGTEGNISQVALDTMENRFGTKPLNVIAVLSPCIRPPHYEVDIASLIQNQLLDAGLLPENIYDSGICTASDTENYYSYRIEKGNTGRMLALLGHA